MLYQFRQYLKFLGRSTNQHGVHSPFVYNLVTQCFYDKSSYPEYKTLKAYRTALLKNKARITVTDLGAGSVITKDNNRQISEIAKSASTTPKRAKLLFRITRYLECQHILELGTSLGIATTAMHLANPKAAITSIEGCPNIYEIAQNQTKAFNLRPVNFINADFSKAIKEVQSNSYDLIFFDGNHQKEATSHYFESLLNTAHNNSVFIFDDIYWSKGMTEAWEQIKQHPKVTVTIDTFNWGLVFFRKEQRKEHFSIRI